MIRIYCNGLHHSSKDLCPDCAAVAEYADSKLDHCPHDENKPKCSKCQTHCYKPEMRQRIIEVMRYAGPRMALHHPIMTVKHALRGTSKRKSS